MQPTRLAAARRPRKGVLSRFGSVLAYLALAAGCANIAGLSDLEDEDPKPSGGSAGRGGTGGKGGSAGKGGTSGEAGSGSNEGGEAGAGATSGASGSGGTSGTGGTGFVGCDDTPLELDEAVVRSCILAESCYPYAPDVGISTCVTYNVQRAFAGRSCTATAKTCEDVLDCNGSSVLYPDAPVECTDTASRCEDNYAVNCGGLNEFPAHFIDCDRMGGTCGLRPDNIADCIVVEMCSEPDPTGNENYASGCDGDDYYYCAGGVGYGQDCTKSAADCEPSGDGTFGCYFSVTACGADSVSCSGETIVTCSAGARYQYDCGSVGLDCALEEEGGQTYSYCVAPGCTGAEVNDCEESCSGSELTFCYGGAPVTVDCQDYGFDTCKEVEEGRTYALCENL